MEAMEQYRPEAPLDDYYVIGWMQVLITEQILEAAISSGDITRAGRTGGDGLRSPVCGGWGGVRPML